MKKIIKKIWNIRSLLLFALTILITMQMIAYNVEQIDKQENESYTTSIVEKR